jgi:hypothetical protein
VSAATSVLDALAERLSAATGHNQATEHAPAIVLWTDGDQKWLPALSAIRKAVPNLWTLGAYDPSIDQGPAAWVKWRLGQVRSGEAAPVLYVPGVRRLQFRSLEDFPDPLKPLAELQFRGAWWTQANGKDWTPLAFLTSKKGGLDLTVAEDAETVSALDRLIDRVLKANVADLARKAKLDAADFVALLTDDLEGDLLEWLDDPVAVRAACPDTEWVVFRDFVRSRLGVDLDGDGAIVVAEHLVQKKGPWAKVWSRYAKDVPVHFSKVHLVLEKAQPAVLMFDKSTLPKHNDEQEQALRAALVEVAGLAEAAARARIRSLEAEHGPRRGWVWAKLGRARMASVLRHIAMLAEVTEQHVAGADLAGIAAWYATQGTKADEAALRAMAVADHADGSTIHGAVRVVYLPWLQRAAERLRAVVDVSGYPKPAAVPVEDGTCLLFADGLRWDVGDMLNERLVATGRRIQREGRWVAFPPVTPTSKPDISAIRGALGGGVGSSDFTPCVQATKKPIDSATFRKLMAAAGVQILGENEVGDPAGRAWTEFGDIDKYGHKHGCKTARHIGEQVTELEQRVEQLLAAGWKRVRVATDHGWLLVPGGMPVERVPSGLTESRWGRCAILKLTSKADFPTLPWSWDPTVDVTYAPGASAFYAGKEYAHGGLTMQECYTPVLTVSIDRPDAAGTIDELKWVGLRCKVKVSAEASGLRMDLRAKVNDASASLIDAPKKVGDDGTCALLVADDRKEGTAAFAVLLGADGSVLDKRSTTVGGES